jgi:hypothetical protein
MLCLFSCLQITVPSQSLAEFDRLSDWQLSAAEIYASYSRCAPQLKASVPPSATNLTSECLAQCTDCLQALLPIEHACFEYLVRAHLEAFLATPEYRQLVRSGRRTVLLLFYQLKVNQEHCSHHPAVQGADSDVIAHGASVTTPSDSVAAPSLLRSTSAAVFKSLRPVTGAMGRRSSSRAGSTLRSPSASYLPAAVKEGDGCDNEQDNDAAESPAGAVGAAADSTLLYTADPLSPASSFASPLGSDPCSPITLLTAAPTLHPSESRDRRLDSLNSEELTAWLARGGRWSSTLSSSTGASTFAGVGMNAALADLFAPVNHADMRELKNFIRYVLHTTSLYSALMTWL